MNLSIGKSVMITMLTVLLASATVNAQWSVPSSDVVIIRGGWLFDEISDTRRKKKATGSIRLLSCEPTR